MQSAALRSAARRAVAGISTRRGIATATATIPKAATATAGEPAGRDWLAEHEKAWVKAMVEREVRAQMAAEEERRIARDRLRAAAAEEEEEWLALARRRRRLEDDGEPWIPHSVNFTLAMEGWLIGFWVTMFLFGR